MKTIQLCSILFAAILMTVSHAGADDSHGIFMVVKGDVKVTAKDGKTEPAKVGKKVVPGDSVVAGPDSRAKIVMSDKNVLNISPDSKIVIEKYENDGKDKKNVELNVLYGKVRASVEQKYDGEKNKFNIKTPSAVAGVRGTDFITGYNASTHVSQIITFSGVVAVGSPGPNGSIVNPVFVRPGQMSNASEGKAPEAPKTVPKEELTKMNSESVSVNDPKPQPAEHVADKDHKNDKDSKDPKATAEPRKPAEAGSPTVSTAPSMIDAKDLGPAVGQDISIRAPASAPVFVPPPMINPQPVPTSTFLNAAIQNQKVKLSVTVTPK